MKLKNMKYSLIALALAGVGCMPIKCMRLSEFFGSYLTMDEQLFNAVEMNDTEAIERVLKDGAEVNAKEPRQHNTPLHRAASKGYVEVVRLLLAKGANPNARNYHFEVTPLHRATWEGHIEVMEILLANGAGVNDEDHDHDTALHKAAYKGNDEAVKVLIAHGANVNARNRDTRRPLHEAVYNNKFGVARLLIENEVDISLKDYLTGTVYDIAVADGYITIATYLALASHYLNNGPKVQVTQQNAQTVPNYFALAILKQDCADIRQSYAEQCSDEVANIVGHAPYLPHYIKQAERLNKMQARDELAWMYTKLYGKKPKLEKDRGMLQQAQLFLNPKIAQLGDMGFSFK